LGVLMMKFKEVLYSVLPIAVIVLLLNFTIASLPLVVLIRFLIGTTLVILGLTIFLFGVDIGITPLGNHIGSDVSKKGKLWLIIAVSLVLGFFISIAEPDLQVLASQVQSVTSGVVSNMSILLVVSAGIGVMLTLGFLRIVYNISLRIVLAVCYVVIAVLSFFVAPEFFPIAFDASGATTGALTVPFILALAVGISSMKKDSKASESDSFGLTAIASTGAIIGVMLLGIFSKAGVLTGSLDMSVDESASILSPFLHGIPHYALESLIAMLPVFVIGILFQIFLFKFQKKQFRRMMKGLAYTFMGLVLFLTGVNAGFMDVGASMGYLLAQLNNRSIVVIVGFILGLVTILAEPAVHVLTAQIEMVTSGYVKKRVVQGALSIGVGCAVALSVLRIIIPGIQLWHYLLPGYIISIALSFIVPKLFVGIAFDSGGVASGPITATFILAFAQGVAESVEGADVLRDAFGMIALVAMMPIITLQILGLIVKIKSGQPLFSSGKTEKNQERNDDHHVGV